MRPVSYAGADVFIVCFSIDEPQSLDNACDKWLKELAESAPKNVARILVGTKCDLRGDISSGDKEMVSTETGENKS